jgi:outer membrane lipoprotein-sorting protein
LWAEGAAAAAQPNAAAKAAPQPAAKAAPKGGAAPAGADAAVDLDSLLARFAKSPGLYARYREEKHMAMLDAPLVNEGTIHFAPPGKLARHTERPIASTLLIDGNRLQFGDAEGKQSMDLATNPVARLFVDSFVMLLAGNRAGLEKYFGIHFAAAGHGAWQLSLTPKVAPMDKVIKELSLRGQGLIIREMEMRESSGDWTRTTFSDVDVNHTYSAAEEARVFRMPKK